MIFIILSCYMPISFLGQKRALCLYMMNEADHMNRCCFKVVLILRAEITQVWCLYGRRPAQVDIMKDHHYRFDVTYQVNAITLVTQQETKTWTLMQINTLFNDHDSAKTYTIAHSILSFNICKIAFWTLWQQKRKSSLMVAIIFFIRNIKKIIKDVNKKIGKLKLHRSYSSIRFLNNTK